MNTSPPKISRILSPKLNPAGLTSAAMAIYAATVMIIHVVQHKGAVDPQVLAAGIGAALTLATRQAVTPVADPRDGNGVPLLKHAIVVPQPPGPPGPPRSDQGTNETAPPAPKGQI